MYFQYDIPASLFPGNVFQLVFNPVDNQNSRFRFSRPVTYGTSFHRIDSHFGPYPLTGDLHQSEFTQRQNRMFRPVDFHTGFHFIIQFLPVFGQLHIDKINNDDASHIPQLQLPGHLFCGRQINFQGI